MNRIAGLVQTAADRRWQLAGAIDRLRPQAGAALSAGEIATSRLSDPAPTQFPPSPFDDLIAAVSEGSVELARRRGPLPPPSRFMVRVSQVDRPHRATKRDYDYFDELNAQLAAKNLGGRVLSNG